MLPIFVPKCKVKPGNIDIQVTLTHIQMSPIVLFLFYNLIKHNYTDSGIVVTFIADKLK